MPKTISILKSTSIYSEPHLRSAPVRTVEVNDYLKITREKLRNGINWYEVILGDDKFGYVDKEKAFRWKKIKIESESAFFSCVMPAEMAGKRISLIKGDQLHIIFPHPVKTISYMVRDAKGREGLMPGEVEIEEVEDAWMKYLFYLIFAILLIVAILAMLNAGFIAFGGLIVLVLLAGSFIVFFASAIVIAILRGIIHQIWIRM